MLACFLTPIIVGHVPLELSRIVFYAIQHGCVISEKVQKERPVRSPLTQGGLEIVCRISATWSSRAGPDRLKDLTKSYSIDKKEADDSEDILKEIGQGVDLSVEQAGTTYKEPEEVEEAVNGVEVLTDEVNLSTCNCFIG